MPQKLHIRKGDTVIVISGEYARTKGKVLAIYPKTQRALVEGVNIISKHTKPNQEYSQGGIIQKEAPVHISNLMLLDPKTGNPTRIGRRIGGNGKLVRYAVKSGEEMK
jgi:large subunit ribosomal protein L24